MDGLKIADIFGKGMGYTYNDIIILPQQIHFSTEDVDLTTKITRNATLFYGCHTEFL